MKLDKQGTIKLTTWLNPNPLSACTMAGLKAFKQLTIVKRLIINQLHFYETSIDSILFNISNQCN